MPDAGRARRLFQVLNRHPMVATLTAAARGVELHLVGGVLRDRLLGLASRDFDAVVAGDGRAIAERAAAALGATLVPLGGRAFAAYRVVARTGDDPFVLDLWDREGTPLEDDLARRDFTVNSFALAVGDPGRPPTGELIDPFGGVADLGRRLLRATTDGSFRGDPLRVLRLPRLAARLPGFAADPATLALARAAAPGLAEVAAERVREELALLFGSDDAHRGLALLAVLDVYPGLWLGAPGRGGPAGGAVAELGSLAPARRLLHRLDPAAAGEVDLPAARLAGAFAHLPAEPAGRPAGAPPPDPGTAVERFRAAGYLTRRVADRVRRLLAAGELPADEPGQRRFLHRLGGLWPTAAVRLGAAALAAGGAAEGTGGGADGWRRNLGRLAALVAADGRWILDPPRLLTGEEVQALLGIPAGTAVGAALAAVERAQVEGRVRTRDEAVAFLGAGA
jgi:hypothetical protein